MGIDFFEFFCQLTEAAARQTQLVASVDDALWEWASIRARQGVDDGHPFEPHLEHVSASSVGAIGIRPRAMGGEGTEGLSGAVFNGQPTGGGGGGPQRAVSNGQPTGGGGRGGGGGGEKDPFAPEQKKLATKALDDAKVSYTVALALCRSLARWLWLERDLSLSLAVSLFLPC